jgi:hypothetical protein
VRGGRCCVLNRVVEIARVREHTAKQRIDGVEEIRTALGGSRGCERNDKRRRAGNLRNQA